MKMIKCLPEFEYFNVFLKNINFISKIRRSKVTDYAALRVADSSICITNQLNNYRYVSSVMKELCSRMTKITLF